MIGVADRRDGWVGPSSCPETITMRALVGAGTFSTRAKWRSSLSACHRVLENRLTPPTFVRDGIYRQLITCFTAGRHQLHQRVDIGRTIGEKTKRKVGRISC